MRISVVIPALNEESTIGNIISELSQSEYINEVLVVDNGSEDQTKRVSIEAGATVLDCSIKGFGRALKVGFKGAQNDWILKIDGDIKNPNPLWVKLFVDQIHNDAKLVKAYWCRKEYPRPVTTLVAIPGIKKFFPALSFIKMPISGIYLVNRKIFNIDSLKDDWCFDIEILLKTHLMGYQIKQAYLGDVYDNVKPITYYSDMAYQIMSYLFDSYQKVQKRKTLMLVMAHPDDAEIWCGGTVIKYSLLGSKILIIVATSNKARKKEANRIKEILKNVELFFLEGKEFEDFVTDINVTKVSKLIGQHQPEILITHHYQDIHLDHRRCFNLTTSGILRLRRKFFPEKIYLCNSYNETHLQSEYFTPDTFVDVSEEHALKRQLISNHQSQEPEYWIKMINTMDGLNGLKCCVSKAEAFQTFNYYRNCAVSML